MKIIALTVKGDHDAVYEIGADDHGLVCTCPAWRYSKESPAMCKHIIFVSHVLANALETASADA